MSSAFWLGWRCILGLAANSKTPQNMLRTRECVLNLPDEGLVSAVNKLALTTGSDPVPGNKQARGYRHEKEKFDIGSLTPVASETVAAPRVKQCPVQMECVVEAHHEIARDDAVLRGRVLIFEVRVQRVWCRKEILSEADRNRVDPDRWQPLIMSFQKFYGLKPEQVHRSTLGTVPEHLYRSPDIDRSHA
jgi:flavin reductase (DIM6/NTAB) family NADH-FMN oxidoreductase RutF